MSGNDVSEIIRIAKETRSKLSELELDLSSEIEDIEQKAFEESRNLTAAEQARHDQLRAMLAETRDAFGALGFVTMQAINNSATVKRLAQDIADANAQIEGDLRRLQDIAAFAKTAAAIVDGLVKVATKLAALAA